MSGAVGAEIIGGSSAPVVTVVICTHNRAHHLAKAIRSLAEQAASPGDFEILVVDNRSTDKTREVVRSFDFMRNLRYQLEPQLGLCHARNAGWQNARGQYIAYLDDDAIASPGWISAIVRAFACYSNAGAVGGRVDPIWEDERPAWLSDDLALGLTIVDWSEMPKTIPDPCVEWLVGANMAVPLSVLAEIGGFNPRLDRAGNRMVSSGDVFLQKQIIERGYACVYYPEMSVQHLVPASRLNKAWFRRRYYWQGISDVIMRLIEEKPSPADRFGLALRKAAGLLMSPRIVYELMLPTDDPVRFTAKCFAWIKVGQIAALLGAARQ